MAAEQYFILQDNNEWKISFNNKHYGPYDTQQDAIEAAKRALVWTPRDGALWRMS